MSEEWWFKKSGIAAGPIPYDSLRELTKNGRVTPQSMVRRGESGSWTQASTVAGLFDAEPLSSAPAAAPNSTDVVNIQLKDGQIRFNCPHCGQHFEAEASKFMGKKVDCPQCQGRMRIPQSAAAQPPPQPPPPDLSSMANMEIVGGDLTCPHCWQQFSKAHLLYIATHHELYGDSVIGQDAQQRFLPTVYNAKGLPLDSRGLICTDMACPRCHLRIPTTVIDTPTLYFSIVGASGSGKSYLLTAMIHKLKDSLGALFNLNFSDADPQTNLTLTKYERLLFLSTEQDKLAVIEKTAQVGDEFSSSVFLDGMTIDLPKPYVFTLSPLPSYHGKILQSGVANRNIVFYDNAGEHFDPGSDVASNPATKHLIHSNGIIFLFDPILDAKMRRICDDADPQISVFTTKVKDQAMLMAEMISRIRRHANMKADETCPIPIVVLIVKYDAWRSQFPYDLRNMPYVKDDKESFTSMLDSDVMANISFHTRQFLLNGAPRIVSTAESFFESAVFLPVSVFGRVAEQDNTGIGIRPMDMAPIWLDTPMLHLLNRLDFIPSAPRPKPSPPPMPNARVAHNVIQFQMPNSGDRVQLPMGYAGAVLEIAGQSYTLPPPPPRAAKASGRGAQKPTHGSFWD